MKKILLIGLFFIMLVEPWLVSLLYCEVLTAKHCDMDLLEACNANRMVEEIETLKNWNTNPFLIARYMENQMKWEMCLF